jgi:transcriptional regulator GlxA family with amidase domain
MDGRSVVVVGYPGAELLDIACITTALDVANRAGAAHDVRTVAPGGRPGRAGGWRRCARGVGPGRRRTARRSARHHALDLAARLARRHPAVHVDPAPIFVRDGPLSTAAGVTSPLDARVRRGGPPEAIWRGWWPAAW